jgi:polysaccharide biosynthesis transport protein
VYLRCFNAHLDDLVWLEMGGPMNDLANGPSDHRNDRQLVPITEALPALRDPYGRLALYGGGGIADESEPVGITLLEYWRILYKRRWLILWISLVVVVLAVVRALLQTPLYTSTVRVQIDRPMQIVQGGNLAQDSDNFEFMQTQLQLLESRNLGDRVATTLKLSWTPSVSVTQVRNSRLFDISYTDTDPSQAQQIANGFADAFIALNIDKRFQANENAKIFLEDKIQQLKLRLEDSEKGMLEFARKQQIVATDIASKSSIAESTLAEATSELSTLISERTKNEELWRQAERSDDLSLPQLLSDPAIGSLRSKRSELEIEYQEGLKTFKPGYPLMVQIRGKLDEIDRQLAAQARTIKDSLKGAYEAALARENELKSRVVDLKGQLLDLQKRSIQYNILKREVDTNRELYTSLLQRYKEVDVAGGAGVDNVFVVDRASPGYPSSTSLWSALLKSLALGVGLGVAVAYGLEKLDNKIHTPDEAEEITGLTLLGVIPRVESVEREVPDPRSALGEAYRSLCTSLQFATANGMPKSLVITSAGAGEGKSFTSLAIARHFALLGRKVLLVDGDLRNPSLHLKLGRENSVGLSNYLTGGCTPPEAIQKTDVPTLAFMASGPLPPNAADLLGSARLVSLFSIGSEVFDLVIFDGPPVLGLADALILSSAVSGTLFVVGSGIARKGLVRNAIKRLQLSRGPLVGAVLTAYDAKAAGYGYAAGYSYDYNSYGAEPNPAGLSISSANQGRTQAQLTDEHEHT